MRASFRNVEHTAVFRGENCRGPTPKRCRLWTQVHGNVVDGPLCAAHYFSFRVGFSLIVDSAQRPFPDVERNIALCESGVQSTQLEFLLAPGPCKEPSLVT